MITYLKTDLPGRHVELELPLDPTLYSNIGETESDFRAGKWIPLTQEQQTFFSEHPHASVAEILACAITPAPSRTLEQAKASAIAAIDRYDASDAVNSFTLGDVTMWLAKADRVGLANSIAVEEAAGRTETTLWFGTIRYVIPIAAARQMLADLELYALECYNITAQHKATILTLDTIEEIEAYDFTAGYPAQPNFSL